MRQIHAARHAGRLPVRRPRRPLALSYKSEVESFRAGVNDLATACTSPAPRAWRRNGLSSSETN